MLGYDDPTSQAAMILDERRTGAFAEAIAAVVDKDDVVLDIGSGSGILALLAARAGARRVYAVEQTAMTELIEEHARANGVDDVVMVLRTSLDELEVADLPEPPTVILSEMLGHFAPDEHAHRLFRLAEGLAVAEPKLVPRGYRVTFAVASLSDLDDQLNRLASCHGVRLDALAQRLKNRPTLRMVATEDLLGPERPAAYLDIDAPLPGVFEGTAVVETAGEANAIVAAFDADLAPGVSLSTRSESARTHWQQVVFPLYPKLACHPGASVTVRIRPRLVTDRGTWVWSAQTLGETRGGDAMRSLVGASVEDVAMQLGLRLQGPTDYRVTPRLRAYQAILAGGLEGMTVDALAERLLATLPGLFTCPEDARQEVLALLRHARAL